MKYKADNLKRRIAKYLLLFLIMVPFFAQTQGTFKDSATIHSNPMVHKDTVVIVQKIIDDNVVKNYQQILEKTNSQLSLWWNPYGLLISVLGILFTILTIISAVIIYRQSKDHKEMLKESITKYESILNQLIEEKNKQLKTVEIDLTNLISEYKKKLETAGEESKKEINEVISKLEKQKDNLETKINPSYVTPEHHEEYLTNYSLWQNKPHFCSKCGYGYFVRETPFTATMRITTTPIGGGSKTITCPKCGNVEIYSSTSLY